MSTLYFKIISSILFSTGTLLAFDVDTYTNFLQENQNLNTPSLLNEIKPEKPYYSSISLSEQKYIYLDSIKQKYNLTQNKLQMLNQNNFVVTERQSFTTFGHALRDIFNKDLPVFLTTDAVLYTVHLSYEAILAKIEKSYLEPTIINVISGMREAFPELASKYSGKGIDLTETENYKPGISK